VWPAPPVADWCAVTRGSCSRERRGSPGVFAKEQGYAEKSLGPAARSFSRAVDMAPMQSPFEPLRREA